MPNFNDMLEAAYIASRRQGDMMRDRDRENSSHEDRRNRYVQEDPQPGIGRRNQGSGSHQTMDTYRPARNNYSEVLSHDHRGKGPRNYRRSDERLQEMVCDLLFDNADLDASDIEVSVKDSEVILSGSVNRKYEKRLAEDLAESISGVVNVENRIRIKQSQTV